MISNECNGLTVLSMSTTNSSRVIHLDSGWWGWRILLFLPYLKHQFLYRSLLPHLLPTTGRIKKQYNKKYWQYTKRMPDLSDGLNRTYTEAVDLDWEIHSSWEQERNISKSLSSLQRAEAHKWIKTKGTHRERHVFIWSSDWMLTCQDGLHLNTWGDVTATPKSKRSLKVILTHTCQLWGHICSVVKIWICIYLRSSMLQWLGVLFSTDIR